jgi:hypothetical protein
MRYGKQGQLSERTTGNSQSENNFFCKKEKRREESMAT